MIALLLLISIHLWTFQLPINTPRTLPIVSLIDLPWLLYSRMATESPCGHLTIGIQVCINVLTSTLCSYFLQLIYAFHPSQKHHHPSSWGLRPATHEGTSQTLPFCLPGLLSCSSGPSRPCHMLSLFTASIVPTISLNLDHRGSWPLETILCWLNWGC